MYDFYNISKYINCPKYIITTEDNINFNTRDNIILLTISKKLIILCYLISIIINYKNDKNYISRFITINLLNENNIKDIKYFNIINNIINSIKNDNNYNNKRKIISNIKQYINNKYNIDININY